MSSIGDKLANVELPVRTEMDLFFSPKELTALLEADRPFVEQFCSLYAIELVDFSVNSEEFPPQGLMYYFSDNLGGYTVNAIKGSLGESKLSKKD